MPQAATGYDTALTSISALSASDIWAVGQPGHRHLAEQWDGTSWALVALIPKRLRLTTRQRRTARRPLFAIGWADKGGAPGALIIQH